MVKNKIFLLAGAGGQLAREFERAILPQGQRIVSPLENYFNITDKKQVEDIVKEARPDIILNCAAYNLVDTAEENASIAFAVNSTAVENLAVLCKKRGIFLVHYSSDYVFDGEKKNLYAEDDIPHPLNVYGESKLRGEEAILREMLPENFLILRLSWLFGSGKQNFLYKLLEWSKQNSVLKIAQDEMSAPTYTEDVVRYTLLSLEKGLHGLYHLSNSDYCSRYEFAKYFAEKMQLKNTIQPAMLSDFSLKAKRPSFSAMSNQKISKALNTVIPHWKDAIDRFAAHLQ